MTSVYERTRCSMTCFASLAWRSKRSCASPPTLSWMTKCSSMESEIPIPRTMNGKKALPRCVRARFSWLTVVLPSRPRPLERRPSAPTLLLGALLEQVVASLLGWQYELSRRRELCRIHLSAGGLRNQGGQGLHSPPQSTLECLRGEDQVSGGALTRNKADERVRVSAAFAIEEFSRLPEVGLVIGVELVERNQEAVERHVLSSISRFVVGRRVLVSLGLLEHAVDGGGREVRRKRRQVNSRGEHGIDETSRVPHQKGAIVGKLRMNVAVVDVGAELVVRRSLAGLGGREEVLDHRRAFDHSIEKFPLSQALHLVVLFPAQDETDGGELLGERDVPEPTMLERDAQDIAPAIAGHAFPAFEVVVERDVLEEWIVVALAESGTQQRIPASGIDDEPGPDGGFLAIGKTNPDRLHLGIEIVDRLKGALLVNFGPKSSRMIEQQLVEDHPLDLKGVEEGRVNAERRVRFTRPVEIERPRLVFLAP